MDMKNFKIIDNDGKYFIDNNGSTLRAVSLGLTKDEKGSLCELFVPEIFLNAVVRLPVLDNDKLPFFQEKSNRKIVCLCGSTKFKADFERADREETAKGNIVLTVAMFGHLEGLDMDSEEKKTFDAVHYDKIKLADEVLVINTNNYIGESTRKEIEYAQSLNKPVRFFYIKETTEPNLTSNNNPVQNDKQTEEKNRGFSFEWHNLSKDEITDVLFYKAKEFYNTKENSMPSSLVIDEIAVDSFGDHYCNDILYVWISLHRTVESAVIALLDKEKYRRDKLFGSMAACVEISKEDILRLRKINKPIPVEEQFDALGEE